ncbi:hypothetical protein AKJ57_04190 [candidate division MSBL1 archaeon SCGC-AAA259A05]|uniref:Phosphoglucosamine mutase n=1 Tax=candidate division MSBL1 archaeon SCGC-AAA259A05 TaxID=1698259 RepID=A0A133U8A2_9EURY|nr:hypothetical protein AKJ57_04190 [candidate division MSBL1 archaeon SCGC-AAA259A05]
MSDLFGTSGIRGVINEDITPELALNLAKSLSAELGGSGKVVVGRDARFAGETIENSLIAGFLSGGCEVERLGIVPTPVVGFAVLELEADAGVMITASHNPPEYNGIKIFDSLGMILPPGRERKIEEIYGEKDFEISPWNEIGSVGDEDVSEDYLRRMTDELSLNEEYKVIVDCANGPTSKTTPALLGRLGCEVQTINSHLDGFFSGRLPEPTSENLDDLGNFVEASDADVGFAHDGDGDRIAAVDEKGRVVSEDKLLALVGSYSAERFGGGMVTTVNASKIVDELVSEAGGEVLRTKVGDVNVAQEMNSQDLKFGGEPSGTWIIGDVHLCPDGTLAAARILEMLDGQEKTLLELVDSISSYPIFREKVDCPNEEKSDKMKSVKEESATKFGEFKDMVTVDGVRLEFENGDWVLIRPSGTEPYIRITAEANEKSRAKSLVKKAKEILSR